MGISGTLREQDIPKYVGLCDVRVIAINPSAEEFEWAVGWPVKEDSKQFEYLGESKDGNVYLRVDIWLEDTKKRTRKKKELQVVENEDGKKEEKEVWVEYGDPLNEKFKVTFFLENKERENKDKTKKQYINKLGICSWADDPDNLPEWFKSREYREAFTGEEQLYNFLRTWLNKLDYSNAETTLDLDWRKLMKGNVKELRDHRVQVP